MLLDSVLILTHGESNVLSKEIVSRVNFQDYELVGPVTANTDVHGKVLYTATLIRRFTGDKQR
jgi:hypothetical protein